MQGKDIYIRQVKNELHFYSLVNTAGILPKIVHCCWQITVIITSQIFNFFGPFLWSIYLFCHWNGQKQLFWKEKMFRICNAFLRLEIHCSIFHTHTWSRKFSPLLCASVYSSIMSFPQFIGQMEWQKCTIR